MPGATQTDLVGVCLAAGAGSRLMPLTLERPKVLCPVGGRPLLSWALDALVGWLRRWWSTCTITRR